MMVFAAVSISLCGWQAVLATAPACLNPTPRLVSKTFFSIRRRTRPSHTWFYGVVGGWLGSWPLCSPSWWVLPSGGSNQSSGGSLSTCTVMCCTNRANLAVTRLRISCQAKHTPTTVNDRCHPRCAHRGVRPLPARSRCTVLALPRSPPRSLRPSATRRHVVG